MDDECAGAPYMVAIDELERPRYCASYDDANQYAREQAESTPGCTFYVYQIFETCRAPKPRARFRRVSPPEDTGRG